MAKARNLQAPGLCHTSRAVFDTQLVNRMLEVLKSFEVLVDAGEAQIGHFVEFTQRFEDGLADLLRRHLRDALRTQALLDLLAEVLIFSDKTSS